MLGCTDGADNDRTEFGPTQQSALEAGRDTRTRNKKKQKTKPNSKDAERWPIKTYADSGPNLGKKRSQFQRYTGASSKDLVCCVRSRSAGSPLAIVPQPPAPCRFAWTRRAKRSTSMTRLLWMPRAIASVPS
jgi:hypothetical protein